MMVENEGDRWGEFLCGSLQTNARKTIPQRKPPFQLILVLRRKLIFPDIQIQSLHTHLAQIQNRNER